MLLLHHALVFPFGSMVGFQKEVIKHGVVTMSYKATYRCTLTVINGFVSLLGLSECTLSEVSAPYIS